MWIMCILHYDMDHPESQDSNSELLLINHINNGGLLFDYYYLYNK